VIPPEGLRIGLAERERQAMGGRWSKEVERNEYGAGDVVRGTCFLS
jgi:hypothetical protein